MCPRLLFLHRAQQLPEEEPLSCHLLTISQSETHHSCHSSDPLSTQSLVFIPPSSIILIQLEPSKCNCPSAVAMSSTILINFLNFISRDLLLLLSSGVPGTGWWCCDLTASGDLRCPVSTVAQLRRTLVTVFSASTSTSYKSWTRSILSTMAHLLEHNVFFCPCTHKPLQTYAFT